MARFAQYAMVASEEALKDAGWMPKEEEDLEATVCFENPHFSLMLRDTGSLYGIGHWESR